LRRGAAGLRRGRAVHDTLAAVDLETGVSASGIGAADLARQYARGHGLSEVVEQEAVVHLVEGALAGPLRALVAGRRVHPEMPVAVPIGPLLPEVPGAGTGTEGSGTDRSGTGTDGASTDRTRQAVLEGTVDLVVETDEGYVVVDYKTSAETDPAGAVVRYSAQLAAYALALELVDPTRPVAGAYLYLLGTDGARLEPLADLRDAIGEIPALAARALAR